MVTNTLETILNEKVGYHFCQVILLFWLLQHVVPCMKYKILLYFISDALADPREKANDPQVENHWFRV